MLSTIRFLLVLGLLSLLASPARAQIIPFALWNATSDLVYWYKFDNASSPGANSATGSCPLTFTSASTVMDAERGRVAEFTGNGSKAVATGCYGILGTQARTVAFWARFKDASHHTNGGGYAVLWGADTSYNRFGFYGGMGDAYAEYSGPGQWPTKVLFNNHWQHIAIVWQGSTSYLYVNGVQHSTLSLVSPNAISTTQGHEMQFGRDLQGRLDDIRIYNTALSAANVAQLFNSTLNVRGAVCSTSADCNDGNSCSNDSCSAGQCVYTANASCYPQTCADAQYAKGLTVSGNTTLYYQYNASKPLSMYCRVNQVAETFLNFAQTSSTTACSATASNSSCSRGGGAGPAQDSVNNATKVQMDVETMGIYNGDATFYAQGNPNSTGGLQPWGTAGNCISSYNPGYSYMNLTGLPLMFAVNSWFINGAGAYGTVTPYLDQTWSGSYGHKIIRNSSGTRTILFENGGYCSYGLGVETKRIEVYYSP